MSNEMARLKTWQELADDACKNAAEIAALRQRLVAAEAKNAALLALVGKCRPAVKFVIRDAKRAELLAYADEFQALLTEIDAALKEGK